MVSQQSNTDIERESGNGYQYIGLLVVGILFLLVSGIKLTSTGILVHNSLVTDGTVVNISREANVAGNDFDTYLTVEFGATEGELVRFKDKGPAVDVGDKVNILYNPANPSEARIRDSWQLWGVWSLFLGVGAVMALWGLIKLRSKRDAQ